MHLKSLTLRGFKSFASATTMVFEPGICAVVGPNGSGKSNVVDALAWVMGEQGAKTLRGASMQDVIFAGAGDRKPLGRAEVTLTIDNHDGKLPIDYSEVAITRRMFRDGASEYEINGNRARLLDVQELLSDSGIGREMHVIVGQGKLAEILASRPDERRAYIEEAAGVLKHRRRREKALRKITGMQANVDRLTDLTAELAQQLKPLGKQADAARRARHVQQEVRQARLTLAAARVLELRENATASAEVATKAAAELAAAQEELTALEAQVAAARSRAEQLQPQVEEAQKQRFQLAALAEKVQASQRIASERLAATQQVVIHRGFDVSQLAARIEDTQQKLDHSSEELELASETLSVVEEELQHREDTAAAAEADYHEALRQYTTRREEAVRLAARQSSVQAQLEAAIEASHQAEERLEQAAAAVVTSEEALSEATGSMNAAGSDSALAAELTRANDQLASVEARLTSQEAELHQTQQCAYQLDAQAQALRAQLPTGRDHAEVLGDARRLAELVRPAAHARRAVAAVLGTLGEAFVGEEPLGLLAEKLRDSARTAVVARGVVPPRNAHDDDAELPILPRGSAWLQQVVEVDPSLASVVGGLLKGVALVPTVAVGEDLLANYPSLRAVTPEGTLLGPGWIEAGVTQSQSIDVHARLEEATTQHHAASRLVEEKASAVEQSREEATRRRQAVVEIQQKLAEEAASARAWRRDLGRVEAAVASAQKAERAAQDQAVAAHARVARLEAELVELVQREDTQLSGVDRVRSGDEVNSAGEREPSPASRDAAREAVEQTRAMQLEARLRQRSVQEENRQLKGRLRALEQQLRVEQEQQQSQERQRVRQQQKILAAHTAQELAALLLGRVHRALERADAQLAVVQGQWRAEQQKLAQTQPRLEAVRHQHAQTATRAHEAELAAMRAGVRRDEEENQVVRTLGISLVDLVEQHAPGEDFDKQATTQALADSEKELKRLGVVNPLALEEFAALEERYSFLSTQLADLEQARADLEQVVAGVDKQIQELFEAAWRDTQAEFPKVFATLFPGGAGRLYLTDPDDMLNTGIELEARPPGKKVQRLSLLSGGEKSLTALALLVAIFRARPSPFYVMDEVEAALDEVNLQRLLNLLRLLREDSQLIVITHQKATMDIANVLYGVTMRSDGVSKVLSQRMQPTP